MDGFAIALSEITLVLFTTLAPSGAVAYLLTSLPVLTGRATGEEARRLNQLTFLPLVIAMVGLIASATHLGNPSNALAGVFWLYSFAEHPRTGLQRVLLAVIDGAIVAFVTAVAFAYDVDTIITWSLPLVPVALMLNALVGGPLIALVGFAAAGRLPLPGALLCTVAAGPWWPTGSSTGCWPASWSSWPTSWPRWPSSCRRFRRALPPSPYWVSPARSRPSAGCVPATPADVWHC